jgi:hypothetical protein
VRGKRDAYIDHDARGAESTAPLLRIEATTRELYRKESIHSCSEGSLEFVSLSGLETDEDTNIIALNLMDYFLFSPENWLPDLSYCKLHAACFLFASRITGKSNTVDQIAHSLGPDSPFVQLVGSPLAGDEESAVAIQYTISVTGSDVQDGYALLYERKEMFGHLLGQYRTELDNLPVPHFDSEIDDAPGEKDESENWDIFEGDE